MLSPALFFLAGLPVVAARARFEGNINYLSPSTRHPSLGIDVNLVQRRSWKRDSVDLDPSQLAFTHGVASGDPFPHSVILWTRVAPSNESDGGEATINGTEPLYSHETHKFVNASPNPICVQWSLFTTEGDASEAIVASGEATTSSDIDYTVKVEARGLDPLTSYYYQFNVCDSDKTSPVGRTRTAPIPDDDVSEMSFAVFSCANYPWGYFNAYGNAARKESHDYVIHLGDYLYENDEGGERAVIPPTTLFRLHDYRSRHGQYRSDLDLQLLSKDYAWIPTWDDHEFADNGYRDGFSGLANTEDSFLKTGANVTVDTRKVSAVRAYFEWMPIRQTDMDDGLRVWRSFQMGNLLDLIMIDTRNYDRSITTLGSSNYNYIDRIRDDPSRTLMGSRQETWFYNSLRESQDRGARWRIVGNQIVFSRIFDNDKGEMSGDDWNSYVANRNRTLKHIFDNEIGNNVFLSGDSHQNWVSDIAWLGTKPYDKKTGRGAVGVEFAGTAVTSTGLDGPIEPTAGDSSRATIGRNDEMQWQEGYYRGYFILNVRPHETTAQFYGSPSVATRNPWDILLANFTIRDGENHLKRPVANGRVESGAVRDGTVRHTNLTLNTETGEWKMVGFEKMYL